MRGNRILHDAARHTVTVLWFPTFISLLAIASHAQAARHQNAIAPNELVRRVVASELKAEQQDHSHWSVHLPNTEAKRSKRTRLSGRNKIGRLEAADSYQQPGAYSQTKAGIRETDTTLVRNPDSLRIARAQQDDEDTARSQRLLKMLPDAFNFSYGQRQGDLVQLNFATQSKVSSSYARG
jgi:hypothetical protein